MATVSLGFLSANSRGHSAHYDDFLRLVPEEAEVQIIPLNLWQNSLYDLEGKTREHIERTTALVAEHGWDGIALMGAPMQVQNPEHVEQLRSLLSIPATTALESGAAAVKAFGARRILLLTPFDDGLNAMLREFLTGQGLGRCRAGVNNRTRHQPRGREVDGAQERGRGLPDRRRRISRTRQTWTRSTSRARR